MKYASRAMYSKTSTIENLNSPCRGLKGERFWISRKTQNIGIQQTSMWSSQVALVVKNSSASAGDIEIRVWSLGWENPLEEGMATHSSVFAWSEKTGGQQSTQSQSQTQLKRLSTQAHRHLCVPKNILGKIWIKMNNYIKNNFPDL